MLALRGLARIFARRYFGFQHLGLRGCVMCEGHVNLMGERLVALPVLFAVENLRLHDV